MMRQNSSLPLFVQDLLGSPPHRGGGLNLWFYRVARLLHHCRDAAQIIELLRAATADEPIKHGEIERAVERSKATAWKPGQPAQNIAPASAWPKLNTKALTAVITAGGGLVDLWESSPVRLENNRAYADEIIDALFPGDPLLCCGETQFSFETRSRSEWRGALSALQFIVPSPMRKRTGLTQEGKESAHALSITGPRRFLVVEQDRGTIDVQAAVLLHLAEHAPLALAVHSGGKSIHGWFCCADQPEEKLRNFMRYFVSLGADPAPWTRSQFVRMPDGTRDNGRRQVVYFFNPGVLK
jgi:hypothetical protein